MRFLFLLTVLFTAFATHAQSTAQKSLPAKRTTATIKIDGRIDEPAWKEAVPATQLIEWRPTPDRVEDSTNRTVVYLLYDNTSVYIGGYCYERTKDSISRELIGRDLVGVNDFVGIIFDTYYDKINGVGFYVTPYGEQYDAKYSNSGNEDDSWNSVWDSEAEIHEDGWSFEMRIPYSALRFSNRENQNWGLNITRRRNKTGQQYMWNRIDPKVSGLMNQEGVWTGIEKIEPPLRLSLSPYFSAYLNHYPNKTAGKKEWTSSVNGGMDVKYGINEAFTLDMTLIPDFGQVQSDNQVLNLSPFEVKFNENRAFFTEGTELFSKGNLFYSRRIGGQPMGYWRVPLAGNERIVRNPSESKLINATKISGRARKGLGIGFFNAITKPMYAEIEDDAKNTRRVQTNPLTNYNIMVLDQSLKNNSSVSLINTNVLRNGPDYDANVTAGLFNFNNRKNTYNWNGKLAVSQLSNPLGDHTKGFAHSLGFGKTGGRWNYQITQESADDQYDINDMGILFNNNFIDHRFWTGYRWIKPGKWYNRIQVNYNMTYSRRFSPSSYQRYFTNVNGNVQFKNLWWAGAWVGLNGRSNDFYEPRRAGHVYKTPESWRYNLWFETNYAKKYSVVAEFFTAWYELFEGKMHQLYFSHKYRFSDKFSVTQDIMLNPFRGDAGYYNLPRNPDGTPVVAVGEDILFSRRDRQTVENIFRFKYNFNNRSGITFRARHYWSKVEPQQLFDLQADGTLLPTKHGTVPIVNQNYNTFNIDAVYTLQFAPGSFINIVWKNAIVNGDQDPEQYRYLKNLGNTIEAPQNNNLSIKILYFLDYVDFKKWGKGKRKAEP